MDRMNAAPLLCERTGCPVAQTGKCDLKHDPVELCPHYGKAPQASQDTGEERTSPRRTKPSPVKIAAGETMEWADLDAFSRGHRVRTVSVIGEPRSGKTTLIAALYASLCRGPVGDHEFVGSRTLVGFARRHHMALLNSDRKSPKTPRTSRDDPTAFLHLALRPRSGGAVSQLIVSDRSGEAYQAARQDTALVKELRELQLADRACFVLNAAKLTNPERHAAYSRQFKQMIYALRDNGAFREGVAIEVLATKIDATKRPDRVAECAAILDEYEARIVEEFRYAGIEFGFHRVCALPKTHLETGYFGVDETLARWTAPRPLPDVAQPAVKDASRQIDRLLAKW
jgi:Double-GTPase 2